MKRFLSSILIILLAITAMGKNEKYKNYCKELKEKLDITLSVPESVVSFHDDGLIFPFTFGEIVVFTGGPVVKLSDDCSLVMMNNNYMKRLHITDYTWTTTSGWMLDNCDMPFCEPMITNTGIRNEDGTLPFTKEETAAWREKIAKQRSIYERCIENDRLTCKVNCDNIYIVRIPNMERVTTQLVSSEVSHQKIEAELKENATECYGVEFYNNTSHTTFIMLFFINGNNATIDECVAKIADYVKFE